MVNRRVSSTISFVLAFLLLACRYPTKGCVEPDYSLIEPNDSIVAYMPLPKSFLNKHLSEVVLGYGVGKIELPYSKFYQILKVQDGKLTKDNSVIDNCIQQLLISLDFSGYLLIAEYDNPDHDTFFYPHLRLYAICHENSFKVIMGYSYKLNSDTK